MNSRRRWSPAVVPALVVLGALAMVGVAAAQGPVTKKPNILVIFGDDVGQTNLSAYSMGLMGYRTPNIWASCLQRRLGAHRG